MSIAANTYVESIGGITEISVANKNVDLQTIVYPMLAHLSQQSGNKWFTWISNNVNAEKKSLNDFNFSRTKVRIINSRSQQEQLWMFWEALSQGNSDTVVASFQYLSESDRRKLEAAAIRGNTRGIVLVQRT
ncbi:Cell division inhibitor SulA [Thalassocella blandensis]|nr:Cell division inhibitor SulA [Thalassocella blandensis]